MLSDDGEKKHRPSLVLTLQMSVSRNAEDTLRLIVLLCGALNLPSTLEAARLSLDRPARLGKDDGELVPEGEKSCDTLRLSDLRALESLAVRRL